MYCEVGWNLVDTLGSYRLQSGVQFQHPPPVSAGGWLRPWRLRRRGRVTTSPTTVHSMRRCSNDSRLGRHRSPGSVCTHSGSRCAIAASASEPCRDILYRTLSKPRAERPSPATSSIPLRHLGILPVREVGRGRRVRATQDRTLIVPQRFLDREGTSPKGTSRRWSPTLSKGQAARLCALTRAGGGRG